MQCDLIPQTGRGSGSTGLLYLMCEWINLIKCSLSTHTHKNKSCYFVEGNKMTERYMTISGHLDQQLLISSMRYSKIGNEIAET